MAPPVVATDLGSDEAWSGANAPFSFNYGGVPSSLLLSHWQFRKETESADKHRYSYTDPETRLNVVAEVRTYADFPGVTDWVIHFKNEGKRDTPILDNILSLDWGFPASKRVDINHARGSTASAEDFRPMQEQLWPQGHVHLEASNGLSSSGDSLPYFNVHTENRGYVVAIGWSGGWKADFDYNQAKTVAQMHMGLRKTHLLLHPGEDIRTPRMVVMRWSGPSWEVSQNRWRQMLFAHYTPQDNGHPMFGPVLVAGWGSEPIADKVALIDWIHEHAIPVSVYAVDAGWYGASQFPESNPKVSWWKYRGDWFPSKLYYPEGIRPLGELLHKDGLGFSLWMEPEVASLGTKLYREHPDWFLTAAAPIFGGAPHPEMALANLGNPVVRKGLTKLVSDLITDSQLTWFRQDFNVGPDPYWSATDTPDRLGMTEIKHIQGLYEFWDALLKEHPGLHIDNCAAGGRRLDIEMLARSFSVWRTDYGFTDRIAEQAQTQALAYWVPQNMGFGTLPLSVPWTRPGPYDTAEVRYLMRNGYSMGFGLSFAPGEPGVDNPEWVAWEKQAIAEYLQVQPYFHGNFYPLLSYTLDRDVWTAWQLDRPEQKDGVILVMRRAGSPYPVAQLTLQALQADLLYDVEVRRDYGHATVQQMKGTALNHLTISLANDPDSAVIFYRQHR